MATKLIFQNTVDDILEQEEEENRVQEEIFAKAIANKSKARKLWMKFCHRLGKVLHLLWNFAPVFLFYLAGVLFMYYYEGWDVVDCVYFITQTLFTIGYGDFTPKDVMGRIFTVFYIIIGLVFVFNIIQQTITTALDMAEKAAVTSKSKPVMKEIVRSYYKKLLFAISMLLIVIAIGVIGFMLAQKLSFVDALYVSVYTMTTVGYGDTPLDDCRVFSIIYMFLSVTTTAVAITKVTTAKYEYEQELKKLQAYSKKLDINMIRQLDTDTEDGGVTKYEFVIGTLIQLGMVKQDDVDIWAERFEALDVDGNGVLELADIAENVQTYNDMAEATNKNIEKYKQRSPIRSFLSSLRSTFSTSGRESSNSPTVNNPNTFALPKNQTPFEIVRKLDIRFDDIFRDPYKALNSSRSNTQALNSSRSYADVEVGGMSPTVGTNGPESISAALSSQRGLELESEADNMSSRNLSMSEHQQRESRELEDGFEFEEPSAVVENENSLYSNTAILPLKISLESSSSPETSPMQAPGRSGGGRSLTKEPPGKVQQSPQAESEPGDEFGVVFDF